MRIVGGAWRGRQLQAPPGQGTRPTADRVRQALFDMLMHAPWGGRAAIEDVGVLDVFAGTGALGLEALSRGAASACFIEHDPVALRVLRANVAACGAEARVRIVAADALAVGRASGGALAAARERGGGHTLAATSHDGTGGTACRLVFLDPPYAQGCLARAIEHLVACGWIAPDALVVAESARDDAWTPQQTPLAERQYGAARITVLRLDG